MTYFGFLAIFVVVPIVILALILRLRLTEHPATFESFPPLKVVAALVVVG